MFMQKYKYFLSCLSLICFVCKNICGPSDILAVEPTINPIRLGVTGTTAIDEFAKHFEDRPSPKLHPKIHFELHRERILCPLLNQSFSAA
jgi:hypothetical protein